MAAAIATGILFGAAVLFTTGTSAQQVPAPPKPPVAVPTPPPLPEDDEGIIEIDTEVVNVLFTAQDRQRRLLTNLRDTDIRLLENGEPQDIVEFVRKIDLPLSLTILIDTSVSQERTLPEEKDAAKSFLESVVRPSKDEVAIISFTGEATLEQGMTGNVSRLRRAVDNVRFVPPSGYVGGGVVVGTPPISGGNQTTVGSTAIWDAVWVTAEEVLGPAPDGTRRAMILLTDGLSNYGLKKMEHAIEAALKAETVIYTIGIGDNFYGGVNEGALKKISESTGGSAFFPRDERELREAFQQIQEEMRSQYLIAYEPTNQARDGSYRKIEVQLVNPRLQKDKVKVTHREGYFAKTGNRK
ncbi:MAG TPA: VWA domain-containing protein [Aridibacter sp.]|nr:VWA domain-containing protein [Aridibacter sp.]